MPRKERVEKGKWIVSRRQALRGLAAFGATTGLVGIATGAAGVKIYESFAAPTSVPVRPTDQSPLPAVLAPEFVVAELSKLDRAFKTQGQTPDLLSRVAELSAGVFFQHIGLPSAAAPALAKLVSFKEAAAYKSEAEANLTCLEEYPNPSEIAISRMTSPEISVNLSQTVQPNQESYSQDLLVTLTSLMHTAYPPRLGLRQQVTINRSPTSDPTQILTSHGFTLIGIDNAKNLPSRVCPISFGNYATVCFVANSTRRLIDQYELPARNLLIQSEPLDRFMEKEVYGKNLASPNEARSRFFRSEALDFFSLVGKRLSQTSFQPFFLGLGYFERAGTYK